MALLSRFFRKSQPPPKSVDDRLQDIEERIIEKLTNIGQPGSSETKGEIDMNTLLLSFEKIDEIRERRKSRQNKSFFQTAAGASFLTAIFTIMATQIPAVTQMFVSQQEQEHKRLTPVLEVIAKDNKLDLGEKLAVIDYVSHQRYRYEDETVDDFLARYRLMRDQANKRRNSAESRREKSSGDQVNPNN